jgi:hypothetical protein
MFFALHEDTLPLIDLTMKYITVCLTLFEKCFPVEDSCHAIIESFVFERQLILSFISFGLSHQRRSTGKILSLSILLRCLAILLTINEGENEEHKDDDNDDDDEKESIQPLHLIAVSLLLSVLDLYQCDDERSSDPSSDHLKAQWKEFTNKGKEFISKNSLLVFSCSRSLSSPHRLDLERVVYGRKECVDPSVISSLNVQLCWSSSEQLQFQVELLFPSSQHMAHTKKKKYSQSVEKMSIQWTHSPLTNLCSRDPSIPFSFYLSPEFVLTGFLSKQSSGNFILRPGDLHFLVHYYSHHLSLYRQSTLFNEWSVSFLLTQL